MLNFCVAGMFPNHIPNPEDKAAMKAIAQAVLENKADLGIIFDTDVGRLQSIHIVIFDLVLLSFLQQT